MYGLDETALRAVRYYWFASCGCDVLVGGLRGLVPPISSDSAQTVAVTGRPGISFARSAPKGGPQTRSDYMLTTRPYSAIIRASSGGVSQRAFSHSRSSLFAPRATAQPFQT